MKRVLIILISFILLNTLITLTSLAVSISSSERQTNIPHLLTDIQHINSDKLQNNQKQKKEFSQQGN